MSNESSSLPSQLESSRSAAANQENQPTTDARRSASSELILIRNISLPEKQFAKGCFICLDSCEGGQYAVLFPCKPATRGDRERGSLPSVGKDIPWDEDCEWDSKTWKGLVETCYRYKGRWKKLVPFYGIVEVKEVTFQFLGIVDAKSRYPISMMPVDGERVKRECEDILGKPLADGDGETCMAPDWHTQDCENAMEWKFPCIYKQAEDAKQRLKKIRFPDVLRKCALNPETARGLYSFEGFEQGSCIVYLEGPDAVKLPQPHEKYLDTIHFRGLYFVLGWQKDRLIRILPLQISCVWLGIAIVWLSVILWKVETGTWELAFGFGQIVAASVALLVSAVRM
ncbi:hypothetical protein F5Y01DRAFT_329247 [Xylaria sp. FL0043]|nr:hypothetical protein F5Y01DRAFT_329247 [Xylaria sp. FL0043]